MRVRNHGKYTNMSKKSPRAIARCDYSGLMVRHGNLVKQMQYRGQGLVFTGFLVNPKFADKPNAQELTPRVKLDPVPILFPRPDNLVNQQTTLATSVGVLNLDVGGNANITLTPEQFNNGSFNFTGVLTGDIVIFVPNVFNQFYANNLTTGAFSLSMQLIGNNVADALVIPYASSTTRLGPLVGNTLLNLQFVNF